MIKNNFNAQGYKAPVCKVVVLSARANYLQDFSVNPIDSAEDNNYGEY